MVRMAPHKKWSARDWRASSRNHTNSQLWRRSLVRRSAVTSLPRCSMRHLRTVCAALAAAALLMSGASRIQVQGHRGARAVRPENTLPAFEYAIKSGVDVLELDLAVTRSEERRVGKECRSRWSQ